METKPSTAYKVLVRYPTLPDSPYAQYWTHDGRWGKPGEGREYDLADLPNLVNNILPTGVPYTLVTNDNDGLKRDIAVVVIVSRVLQEEGKGCYWGEEEKDWVSIQECTRFIEVSTNGNIESNLISTDSFITGPRLDVQHARFNDELLRTLGEFNTPSDAMVAERLPMDYAEPLRELATSMLNGIQQDLITWYDSQNILKQAHRLDPTTTLSNAYHQLDSSLVDSIVRRFSDIEILICASLPSYSYNAEFDSVYNDIRSALGNIRDEDHLEEIIQNATKKVEEAISLLKKQEENKISFLDVLDSNRSSSRHRSVSSLEPDNFPEGRGRGRQREWRGSRSYSR